MEQCARSRARMARALRLAADPQPRDTGRQSGHGVAHRRFRAAAAGFRCRGVRSRRGRTHRCVASGIVLHRIPQDRSRTGRILISMRIPKPLPDEVRFYKIAKRSLDDISTVAAGMSLWRRWRAKDHARASCLWRGRRRLLCGPGRRRHALAGTTADAEAFAAGAALRDAQPQPDERPSRVGGIPFRHGGKACSRNSRATRESSHENRRATHST